MTHRRRVAWTAVVLMAVVGPRLTAATFDATVRIDQQLPDCGIQALIDEAAAIP